MLCVVCHKNEASKSRFYGFLPCNSCQTNAQKPNSPEVVPNYIKEDRKAEHDNTIQPFRKGIVSKEYLNKYGSKYIRVSEREKKNARNVWDGYYND